MSNREHEREEDDGVIERLADALREEVPVRAEWRDRVLGEIDALPPARRLGTVSSGSLASRAWVLSPLAGIAAAIILVAIGAAGTLLFVRAGANSLDHDPMATVAPTVAHVSPVASGGPSSGTTSVRFVIVAANASRVSLVGDFNAWDPAAMPMQRSENGIWVRDVVLEPGRHVYAFYVDGALQVDPSAPRAAEDDFGIPSSALIVRNAGSD